MSGRRDWGLLDTGHLHSGSDKGKVVCVGCSFVPARRGGAKTFPKSLVGGGVRERKEGGGDGRKWGGGGEGRRGRGLGRGGYNPSLSGEKVTGSTRVNAGGSCFLEHRVVAA